jgi:hypothetical protein
MELTTLYTQSMGHVDVDLILTSFQKDVENAPGRARTRAEWNLYYAKQHPDFTELVQRDQVEATMQELQQRITLYASVLTVISRSEQDALFDARSQIASLMVEQHKHEQDVINWSKILQHLNVVNRGEEEQAKEEEEEEEEEEEKEGTENGGGGRDAEGGSGSSGQRSGNKRGNEEGGGNEVNSTSRTAEWSAHRTFFSARDETEQQHSGSTSNKTTIPGMLPHEKHGGNGHGQQPPDELNVWITEVNQKAQETAQQVASEEEMSLYRRQLLAKEHLKQQQREHQLQQQREREQQLQQQQREQQLQQQEEEEQLQQQREQQLQQQQQKQQQQQEQQQQPRRLQSNASDQTNNVTATQYLPDPSIFQVEIQKTARRSEEGLGIVWGQKVRPEEINFYSNILSQEYVVFVRSVIKDEIGRAHV